MQAVIDNLDRILRNYARKLEAIPAEAWVYQPGPGKWSKKEILGHLVDSAQNNIRRVIVAQYEEEPVIGYRQDDWVALSGYGEYAINDLIGLWRLLNRHMIMVLRQVSPAASGRKCSIGGEARTIEWLAADYCNHLLHHLHQILEMNPIAYP